MQSTNNVIFANLSKTVIFLFILFGIPAISVSAQTSQHKVLDFDGDGKTDYVVVQDSNGLLLWHISGSLTGYRAISFGLTLSDVLVPADYDGDGKWDIAVWRRGSQGGQSYFYIQNSRTNTFSAVPWGIETDNPRITQDFDGDGKADPAVTRKENGKLIWYVLRSSAGFLARQFGVSTDYPLRGDYDGDGKADIAVYRDTEAAPSNNFIVQNSLSGAIQFTKFGAHNDFIVPADFDGDGKTDIAVYRYSETGNQNSVWYWLRSSDGAFRAFQFGLSTAVAGQVDFPAPGDYDGDGKTDQTVRRVYGNSQNQPYFYFFGSSMSSLGGAQWGLSGWESPNITLQIAATDHP